MQLLNTQPEKPFIRNKAAQVFALTFVMEYLTLWPKFFFDILSLVGLNPLGLDVYLRTLMAIDAEVVDRNILHSPEVRRSCQGPDIGEGPAPDSGSRTGSRCWCLSKQLFMARSKSGSRHRFRSWFKLPLTDGDVPLAGDSQEHANQGQHAGAVHPSPGGVLVPDLADLPGQPPGAHLSMLGGGGSLRVLDRPQPHRQ